MSDDPYVYPGTTILRNKLGIRDAGHFEAFERHVVPQRMAEGLPTGDFDLPHLRAIHGHLFQDAYDWAGEVRTVELNKGGHQFMFRRYIQTGMADVYQRIVKADYFKDTTPATFAERAATIIGDVNYIHPFREGNGRTQLLYLEQLSRAAGHHLDSRLLDRDAWIEASRRAHQADYVLMSAAIGLALERSAAALRAPGNEARPLSAAEQALRSAAGSPPRDAADHPAGRRPGHPKGRGGGRDGR